MKKLRFLWLLLLFACHPNSDSGEENVLARVNDEYLYESELIGLIPSGTSPRDSLILVKNYISKWVKNKILLIKAEDNLTDAQQDFTKQIEEYRNSLLIFEYEKNLLSKELDTSISDEELYSYYKEFSENFKLREKIYLVRYISIDESNFSSDIRDQFIDTSKLAQDSLYKLLGGITDNFNIEKGKWYNIIDLKNRFPLIRVHDDEEFSPGAYYELSKNPDVIMVNIRKVEDIGETTPFSYIKPQIKEIIINKRKSVFLKNLKHEILEQAISNNEVEIY